MAATPARKRWEEANRERLRAYHAAWRAAHKDRIKQYEENRRAKDPEAFAAKALARCKKNRAKHPERTHEVSRNANRRRRERVPKIVKTQARKNIVKWRKLNPERHRELNRLSAKRHPERAVISQQKRRALLAAAPGNGVTRKEWREIKESYLGLCVYCNTRPAKLVMDHVDALNNGGAHDPSNIAPACGRCNSSKADHSLVVWLAMRRHAA